MIAPTPRYLRGEATEGQETHTLPQNRFRRLGKLVSKMGQIWGAKPPAKDDGGGASGGIPEL